MQFFSKVLAIGVLGLLALMPAGSEAGGAKRPIVVELYTSQGCSSCPPADALLAQLSDRRDVLALSLPITYWDMLGWRDTLASETNTYRQKQYSSVMGHGGIYTPQIIVDGTTDVVGSREQDVKAAIAARLADFQSIPVSLSATPSEVHVWVGGSEKPASREATIWLFHVLSKSTVSIKDGENGGRTLSYRNVVRDVRPIGIWKGQAVSLDLPRKEMTHMPHDGVAVVVQQGGYGRIVGAAMIQHPDYYFMP